MYRRSYRRYRRYSPSLFELLIIAYIKLLIFVVSVTYRLLLKIGYWIYDGIIQTIHESKVSKKSTQNLQEEISPLPRINFREEEEEREVYLPYRKKSFLLTRAEYAFDKVLSEVVGDNFYIGRQVPLSSIVEVTTTYKPYRSKIDKKTIDFVLFNKAGYTPYLAVELDDQSHLRLDRIRRDEFVESVLSKADIRLVRIKNDFEYNNDKISQLIYGNQEERGI